MGEFDRAALGRTNVDIALQALRNAGFSKEYVDNFIIVLWNIPNGYYSGKPKFETYSSEVPNVFYFSGYSASVITFLTSKIKNAKELFEAAMDQEVLNMIEV